MESSWLETRWARPLYLVIVFFLTLGLLQVVKLYMRRQQLLRDLRAFSGPPPHWLTGNQKLFGSGHLEKLDEVVEKYPCAFPAWIGPFEVFFYIYDPDYAKTLLSRTDPKSKYFHKFLVPLLEEGLLSLNGSKWAQHRRLVTPAFNLNILKSHVNVIAQSVNIMLGKWEKTCGTQETVVEVFKDINLMSLDTLMKCTFSQETNCQINSTHNRFIEGLTECLEIILKCMYSFFYHYDIFFKFSPESRRLQKWTNIIHQYTGQVIQEKRKSLKDEKEQGETEKKCQDFLDILLSAQAKNGNGFSDNDLYSEVNTFMIAGVDTIGGTLSWLLYHLAQNPEHQKRCREEIRGILGDGSSITWDQLGEMSYTTMCIKESLRLCPTATAISRELSKPITFPDGRSLPAGMTVVLSIWGLHRNPNVWENPKVFDPLRFSQENYSKRHSHSYLPFSGGLRNCVGQHFAMTELKVAVALILLRFELTPDPTRPLILISKILLKPKNGLHLYLKKIS
ncbi:cytochrome P450 4X1 [Molossus molossus]|uniref:Cytochrome P450 family 4 subfamily X member 1 n=2 Tax=Molossus molossus TaxID=27622 RepID=A0A7J8F722_MOLMO|nr:cytochrome P450 4X1 [Molossus molossus]KAF6443436.1 cytochrome P450 family 4 subfamily X member 1 [Molossus molossus]